MLPYYGRHLLPPIIRIMLNSPTGMRVALLDWSALHRVTHCFAVRTLSRPALFLTRPGKRDKPVCQAWTLDAGPQTRPAYPDVDDIIFVHFVL